MTAKIKTGGSSSLCAKFDPNWSDRGSACAKHLNSKPSFREILEFREMFVRS